MAIRPQDIYPGQITTGDPAYPYGKARNQTVPDDGTGTPWEERLVNDIFGFHYSLLDAASMVPSGTPDAFGGSQYLEAIKRLVLNAQTDMASLNWRSFAGADSMTLPNERLQLAACQDFDGTSAPYLVAKSSSSGLLVRTRDFFQTWNVCTQLVVGVPIVITAICGDMDRRLATADNDLIVMNGVSSLWRSTDAGTTWSAGVALGAGCTVVARSHPLGLVIVAGFGVIKTLTAALGSLTSRTVPPSWAALTPAGIATARGGESSLAGAIVWPTNAVANLMHSPDGITWTNQSVPSGQVVSGCWSQAAQKWFVLTTLGLVYSSPNPSTTAWTLVETLVHPTGAPSFYSIRAFGRKLVIACGGGRGSLAGSGETGSVIVAPLDFVGAQAFTTGVGRLGDIGDSDGFETTLQHFDGQLVAGHIHTYSTGPTYAPNLSVSMRAPWL